MNGVVRLRILPKPSRRRCAVAGMAGSGKREIRDIIATCALGCREATDKSSMTTSSLDGIVSGQLDRVDGSLIRGRLGESTRLYRLRIDGHWYFCSASSFGDSVLAGKVLRHIQLPARVTLAPYVVNGRRRIYWLYSHDSSVALEPLALKRAGVAALLVLLAPVLGLAFVFLWRWVNQLSKLLFVVSLPVVIALAGAALFSGVVGMFALVDVVGFFRPRRLRAYRAYHVLRKALSHGD